MSNLNTLKPFKKGYDPKRNITGLNKGSISITRAIVKELAECPDGQDKHTYLDLIVKRLITKAIKEGDIAALRLIWNYVDGMPKQDIGITGDVVMQIAQEIAIKNGIKLEDEDENTNNTFNAF